MYDLLLKAEEYAKEKHKHQKYDVHPYSKHLQDTVCILLSFQVVDCDVLSAAWLHDIVEDGHVTIEEIEKHFGVKIASYVWEVTCEKGKNRKERYESVYKKLRNKNAILVKLADRIANVTSSKLYAKDKFSMYKKENAQFVQNIRTHLDSDDLIAHSMISKLDSLFGE